MQCGQILIHDVTKMQWGKILMRVSDVTAQGAHLAVLLVDSDDGDAVLHVNANLSKVLQK